MWQCSSAAATGVTNFVTLLSRVWQTCQNPQGLVSCPREGLGRVLKPAQKVHLSALCLNPAQVGNPPAKSKLDKLCSKAYCVFTNGIRCMSSCADRQLGTGVSLLKHRDCMAIAAFTSIASPYCDLAGGQAEKHH